MLAYFVNHQKLYLSVSDMLKLKVKLNIKVVTVLLVLVYTLLCPVNSFDIENGGDLEEDLTLNRWDSPYTVRNHIFVRKDATLTVDPGVEMRFGPGVMLAVNGTLIARVSVQLPLLQRFHVDNKL